MNCPLAEYLSSQSSHTRDSNQTSYSLTGYLSSSWIWRISLSSSTATFSNAFLRLFQFVIGLAPVGSASNVPSGVVSQPGVGAAMIGTTYASPVLYREIAQRISLLQQYSEAIKLGLISK